MRKILTIIFVLFCVNIVFADLTVKTNIESGVYEFPIELNIITNDKTAKIFYYTDGEGRMDNIKEFKEEILLKEDATISYYATNSNYEDTLIKTSTYNFSYSQKINIILQEKYIIIKNNSGKIQNIGYWKVSGDNLNYEVKANTFLENNETLEIDYFPTNLEKFSLVSPDNKVMKTSIFEEIKEVIQKENNFDDNLNKEMKINSDNNIQNLKEEIIENLEDNEDMEIQTGEVKIISNNNDEILDEKNIKTQTGELKNNVENNLENSSEDIDSQTGDIENDFSINENLKSSSLERKDTKPFLFLNIFAILFFLVTLYNAYVIIKAGKKDKNNKN